ncbi:MAG TPA: SCO family protein [Longimicrobiales bacterium]|nr:SCO family protein [Longimicrobiales bacterium]
MQHIPEPAREARVVLLGLIALFVITSAWWALAFWPVQDGPQWLERTRYVCFGVTESGLPNAGGWIGLTAGPLGMLVILLTGWWSGVPQLLERARTSRAVSATLIMLALGCMVLVMGAAARVQQARVASYIPEPGTDIPPSTYPRLDRTAPALELLAHDGVVRNLPELRGAPVLVTFAYAHCETVCPLVVKHVLTAQETLRTGGTPARVLIVTLDPWRDTPSRLPSMATTWGLPPEDAWVLGGAVPDVEAALDAWDVPRTRDLVTGEVTHPSLVYVIDQDGRIAYATTGGSAAIVSLVERL